MVYVNLVGKKGQKISTIVFKITIMEAFQKNKMALFALIPSLQTKKFLIN